MRAALLALLMVLPATIWPQPTELVRPVEGPISSPVGPREGMGGYERFHRGIDLSVPIGTPVKAIADGTVVTHWPAPNGFFKGHEVYGGYIVIKHCCGTGLYSAYAHLSRTFVQGGQWVYAGETIAESGDSGLSTGPHLHLEIWVDPAKALSYD